MEQNAAGPLFDAIGEHDEPETGAAVQDPLKLYVRPIGDGRLLTPRGAGARAAQGRGGRAREAEADRVEPAPGDVDHTELHACGRAAARPDPGGQPRPDPGGREVRLDDGLQALDVRDVVDPAGGAAGPRRAEPHDPAAGARRRPGPADPAGAARARAAAEPRSVDRRDRRGDRADSAPRPGAARPRPGPREPRDARRGRRERDERPDRGHLGDRAGGGDRAAAAVDRARRALAQLKPRLQRVLVLRFGLDGSAARTLEQVGVELGITRERVRQLETRALRELRPVAPSLELYLRT